MLSATQPKVGRVGDLNPGLNTQERNKTQIYFFIDVNNTNSIPGFPFSALSFIYCSVCVWLCDLKTATNITTQIYIQKKSNQEHYKFTSILS